MRKQVRARLFPKYKAWCKEEGIADVHQVSKDYFSKNCWAGTTDKEIEDCVCTKCYLLGRNAFAVLKQLLAELMIRLKKQPVLLELVKTFKERSKILYETLDSNFRAHIGTNDRCAEHCATMACSSVYGPQACPCTHKLDEPPAPLLTMEEQNNAVPVSERWTKKDMACVRCMCLSVYLSVCLFLSACSPVFVFCAYSLHHRWTNQISLLHPSLLPSIHPSTHLSLRACTSSYLHTYIHTDRPTDRPTIRLYALLLFVCLVLLPSGETETVARRHGQPTLYVRQSRRCQQGRKSICKEGRNREVHRGSVSSGLEGRSDGRGGGG